MSKTTRLLPKIGLMGITSMGGNIAERLLQSDYILHVCDVHSSRLDSLINEGAVATESPSELAAAVDFVLVSLPTSEDFVKMVETKLLQGLRRGKTVIDLGNTEIVETRRIRDLLEERGVSFLDAPISGTDRNAREGSLSIFCGGKKEVFKRCIPILNILAGKGKITYCGTAGAGQAVKACEQVAVSLSNAAFLESLAFANALGIQPGTLLDVLEKTPLPRINFEVAVKKLMNEGGDALSVNFKHLNHLLTSARAAQASLPLTEALNGFLQNAPANVVENGQLVPSLWAELLRIHKK